MSDWRLPPHPAQRPDRGKPITFTFEGRPIHAYEGETVAAALYAAGVRIFSRSFKYRAHLALGARWGEEGGWRLPEFFADPGVEAERVGQGVGLQDASAMLAPHHALLLRPFSITRFWDGRLVGEKAAAAVSH